MRVLDHLSAPFGADRFIGGWWQWRRDVDTCVLFTPSPETTLNNTWNTLLSFITRAVFFTSWWIHLTCNSLSLPRFAHSQPPSVRTLFITRRILLHTSSCSACLPPLRRLPLILPSYIFGASYYALCTVSKFTVITISFPEIPGAIRETPVNRQLLCLKGRTRMVFCLWST